jgi:hypothetical protein
MPCPGCKRCGHEGGRKGRVKAHSARNPCAECDMAGGACAARAFTACGCAWHARQEERVVLRVGRLHRLPLLVSSSRQLMERIIPMP